MNVVTTLRFSGRTEEALNFYRVVLDAETLFLMRFRESPEPSHLHAGMEDKIFHATFRIGDTTLMASDVGCAESQAPESFAGFSLAIRAESPEKAAKMFDALGDGGKILVHFAKSSFTSWYGIVIDRFGVSWKLLVD